VIVVDASVMIDALTADGPSGRAARKATMADPHWIAPAHLVTEVTSGIRGLLRGGKISARRADDAVQALAGAEIELAGMQAQLPWIWELRDNLTPYDAAYIALAEAEGCVLVTGDGRLAAVPGIRCQVQLIG
jgi:predicted nucleic acid-binding protein